MAAVFALGSAAIFGVSDFLGALAARRVDARIVTTISSPAGFLAALPILAVVGGAWTPGTVLAGVLAGLLGSTGLTLLFQAMAEGPIQLVSPVSAVVSGLVPVAVGVALGERPGTLAVLGLLLAPPSVWILAGGRLRLPDHLPRRPLLLAVLAGLGFGLFFVALDAAPAEAGFIPVVAAKATATVGLVTWAVMARKPVSPGRAWRFAVASGVLDMAANGLFLLATRRGDLSTSGALVSLYPAGSSLLAARFLGERLGRLQAIGFGGAIAAGLLLSV